MQEGVAKLSLQRVARVDTDGGGAVNEQKVAREVFHLDSIV